MAGQPAVDDAAHLRPRRAVPVASAPERAPPEVADVMLEGAPRRDAGGQGVVIVPAGDHASQPSPLVGDRRVPPTPEFLLEFMQLGAHPVAPRLPPKQEAAAPGASADVREAQEVETLRLAETAPLAVGRREAAELDEARLCLIERQREARQPLVQRIVLAASGAKAVAEPEEVLLAPTLVRNVICTSSLRWRGFLPASTGAGILRAAPVDRARGSA